MKPCGKSATFARRVVLKCKSTASCRRVLLGFVTCLCACSTRSFTTFAMSFVYMLFKQEEYFPADVVYIQHLPELIYYLFTTSQKTCIESGHGG